MLAVGVVAEARARNWSQSMFVSQATNSFRRAVQIHGAFSLSVTRPRSISLLYRQDWIPQFAQWIYQSAAHSLHSQGHRIYYKAQASFLASHVGMFNIYRIIPWCLVRPVSQLLAVLKGISRSPAGIYSGTLDAACVHLSPDLHERLHDPLLSRTTLDLGCTWLKAIATTVLPSIRLSSLIHAPGSLIYVPTWTSRLVTMYPILCVVLHFFAETPAGSCVWIPHSLCNVISFDREHRTRR